jgi:2-polyprenyl-6-methoxyphenol hydroxylase-like FAD-dependent oxidoreductase
MLSCCSTKTTDAVAPGILPHTPPAQTRGVHKDDTLEVKESTTRPPAPLSSALAHPAAHSASGAVSAVPAVPDLPATPTVPGAMVIGGGLAGTLAAIALKQHTRYNTLPVTVLESRDSEAGLATHLNLRMDTLVMLKRLGLWEKVQEIGGWIEHISRITLKSDGSVEGISVNPRESVPRTIPDTLNENPEDMLKQPIVFQVRVSDLVGVLREHAATIGVTFHFACTATARMLHDGKISVQMDGRETGSPEMLVLAEGPRREIVRSLGVVCAEGTETAHYLSGVVKKDVGPTMRRRIMPHSKSETIRRTICVGHAKNKEGWGLAEVPQAKYEKLSAAPAEKRVKYFQKHMGTLIGEAPLGTEDTVGGDRIFTVRNTYATQGSVGTNAVLFGDTLRVAHFATSPGANGLFYDVEALIDAANAGIENASTREAYSARVMKTTEACMASGMPEFVSREA